MSCECLKTPADRYQEGGAITAVSFRTDGLQMMVSGNNAGSIVIWDLGEKAVHSVLHNAHSGSVTSLSCVHIILSLHAQSDLCSALGTLPPSRSYSRRGHVTRLKCGRLTSLTMVPVC